MVKKIEARITAVAAHLPDHVLTNDDLARIVDTSNDWIVERTGIHERRIASSNEFTSTMGYAAAKQALEKAHVSADQVDAIICTTMTPDFISPSSAALIQHQLKATHACALDIQAACTGFLYGLSLAKGWIESGMYQTVLVVSSEKNSAFIDYQDRNTCILFGDGAGAALVQAEGSGLLLKHISLGADGSLASLIEIPAGGCRNTTSENTVAARQHFLKMQGKEVFKHAVRRMEACVRDCLEKTHMPEHHIDWLIPHQANIRIMESIAKNFSIPWERVYKTIARFGNTSSSTIPIALAELEKEHSIKENENIVLVAFGGGLTWGASLLTKIECEKK